MPRHAGRGRWRGTGCHFTPPADQALDWLLWVTDGTNLNDFATHPSAGAVVVQ